MGNLTFHIMTRQLWDAAQTKDLFVVGVNGSMVPQHRSIDEFCAYLLKSFRHQNTMHVLFAAVPGMAGFVDNYSINYKYGGRWGGSQTMDYNTISSMSELNRSLLD